MPPLYYPILDLFRSGYIDNRFYGIIAIYNKSGVIKKIGSGFGSKFYLRSMLKPIQASILTDEIIDYYNFTEEELAVMQASHSGEKIHRQLVKNILKKIGLSEDNLLCPVIPPLYTKQKGKWTKIHNNCSGKHSMMLVFCQFHKLDISNYNDINHPVQKKILENLLNFAQTDDYISTKDGCTVPVYGLKLKAVADMFLNYYSNKTKLTEAYRKNPYLIGGKDDFGLRTDTKIMELNQNLISKVGAGGFIYVYNSEKKEILIVKLAQNNNKEREIITLEILYRLKWLSERFYDNNIYTESGETIGNYCLNGFDDEVSLL